VTTTVSVKTL
jgi:hypothetical protein